MLKREQPAALASVNTTQTEFGLSKAAKGQVFGKKIDRQTENMSDILCEQYQRDFLKKSAEACKAFDEKKKRDSSYRLQLKRSQYNKFI